MALPQSLRVSVTPPELELISCQQLVEIIPLIPMERTAFISVHLRSQTAHLCLIHWSGCIRAPSPSEQGQDTSLDGCKSKDEEKVSYRRPWLAKCWCVCNSYNSIVFVDRFTQITCRLAWLWRHQSRHLVTYIFGLLKSPKSFLTCRCSFFVLMLIKFIIIPVN